MRKSYFIFLLLGLSLASHAWQHSVSLGVNPGGADIRYPEYTNSGMFFHGKLYRFSNIDSMLVFTIDASLGLWKTDAPVYQQISTIALSGAFRAYFTDPIPKRVRPYLELSYGPAYLSEKQFGLNQQAMHFALQGTIGGGVEIGKDYRGFDVNFRFVHYSNSGIAHPNEGFEFLYVISVGYLI